MPTDLSFFPSVALLTILTAVVGPVAHAQVIERPSRPFRGVFGGGPPADPNRPRQELTLSLNTLGSFNDDPGLETGGLGGGALLAREPERMTSIDSTLRYFLGRVARSVEATGLGFFTSDSTAAGSSLGGDLEVHGTTTLGRMNQLNAEGHTRYSHLRIIGASGSLDDDVYAGVSSDSNPMNGFAAGGHSWVSGAVASFSRRWTTHDTTSVRYGYSRSDYETGFGYDSQENMASVVYTRSFGRTLELAMSYVHSNQRLVHGGGAGAMHPMRQGTGDLALRYRRRLSPTRSMSFSAGAGMSQVRTVSTISGEPFEPRSPSGHSGVSIDIGRSWAVGADYRRTVSVLDGITRQPFVTDAVFLNVGGHVGRRLDLALSGGYSGGHAAQGGNAPGQYESSTATAQGRYAIARCCAATVSYSYYGHRLQSVVDAPGSLPTQFDRKTLRVGISLWLPLYGSPGAGGR